MPRNIGTVSATIAIIGCVFAAGGGWYQALDLHRTVTHELDAVKAEQKAQARHIDKVDNKLELFMEGC